MSVPSPDVPPPLPAPWSRRLAALLRHPDFARGLREMAPVGVGIGAWGFVTGVAMVKAGLSVPLALLMTFTVFAGSAQLAALPLMASHAPAWLIWATAACVNLRFVVFAVQWRPYLMRLPLGTRIAAAYFGTDTAYVLFMKRFPEARPQPGQMPYLAGASLMNWLSWQVPSVAGIVLVDAIPAHWGLGFAGVLALLALGLSLVTDRATALSAAVAGVAAVASHGLPLKLNILVAIVAAVAVGLLLDGRRGRPSP